jgi:aerobic carbon-monoxide dehydrogenase medium subunit
LSAVEPRFVAPRDIDEALAQCATQGAVALGGGAAVALMLKERLVEPTKLVYLGKVAGLDTIESRPGGELRLGATVTLRDLQTADAVRRHCPILAEVAGKVGNPRVRSVATLGGTLAHADPRQDLPPMLLALGARVRVANLSGSREVPLSEFFVGFMETAMGDGEIIVEVIVPPGVHRRSAYQRFTPASQEDYATVGVAASVEIDEVGLLHEARVALGGVGSKAFLVDEAGLLVQAGRPGPDDVDRVAASAAAAAMPFGDARGSVEYKREMVRVHVRRALEACLHEPSG